MPIGMRCALKERLRPCCATYIAVASSGNTITVTATNQFKWRPLADVGRALSGALLDRSTLNFGVARERQRFSLVPAARLLPPPSVAR